MIFPQYRLIFLELANFLNDHTPQNYEAGVTLSKYYLER